MAFKSSFFNSVNKDRVYKAEDFAEYFGSFIENGIFPEPLSALEVTPDSPAGLSVVVKEGKAWINGYYFNNYSDSKLTVPRPDGVMDRVDAVALQWNKADREIKLIIKEGQPHATKPTLPELVRNDDIYEMFLAQVVVPKNATSIIANNIVDLRDKQDAQKREYAGTATAIGKDGQAVGTSSGGSGGGSSSSSPTAPPSTPAKPKPADITELKHEIGDKNITITWKNPTSNHTRTVVRYQEKSYPTSYTDGQSAYDGTGTTVNVNNLTNGTQYFFRVFTLNDSVIGDSGAGARFTATPTQSMIYGVRIDMTNSDPEKAVVYTDEAVNFKPATRTGTKINDNGWSKRFPFSRIKPCVLGPDGTVVHYLNPDDYTKQVDGQASTLSGTAGNVMVEIPKVHWKFEISGNYLDIKISDRALDQYVCLAHSRGNVIKNHVYIGAYLGFEDLNTDKLVSKTGERPTAGKNLGEFRTLARANGDGYDVIGFYQVLLLQLLYLFMFKNLDSQTTLGEGFTDGDDVQISGTTNKNGLYFGNTGATTRVKFAGIEDIYGNLASCVEGIQATNTGKYRMGTANFNDDGTDYIEQSTSPVAFNGFFTRPIGSSTTGFLPDPDRGGGSQTTFYCDSSNIIDNMPVGTFGGSRSYGKSAGMFNLQVSTRATDTSAGMGARLMFLSNEPNT